MAENQESARLSKQLTLLDKDAPIEWNLESYNFVTSEKLTDFFDLIEARALLRDFKLDEGSKLSQPKTADTSSEGTDDEPKVNVTVDRDNYKPYSVRNNSMLSSRRFKLRNASASIWKRLR